MAELQIVPQFSAIGTYYDNITLSSQNKNAELVGQLQPGILISHTTRKTELNLDYEFNYYKYYGDEFEDRQSNTGSATANFELIENHLFLDSSVVVSQQVLDPAQASNAGSAVFVGNETESRTFYYRPRLRNRFGGFMLSEILYESTFTEYTEGRIEETQHSNLRGEFNSGDLFDRLSWVLTLSKEEDENRLANNYLANGSMNYTINEWYVFASGAANKYGYLGGLEGLSPYFIHAQGGAGWTPSRKIAFELGVGTRINESGLTDGNVKLENKTWRASINFRPTNRTNLSISRDEAVFGSRESLNFSHTMRRVIISANYSEALTTPQILREQTRAAQALGSGNENIGLGGDNIGGTASGTNIGLFDLAVTNDVLLHQQLNGNMSIQYRRLVLSGGGGYSRGEYQTANIVTRQFEVNSRAQLQLGGRTSLSGSMSARRYYFSTSASGDNLYSAECSINRQIQRQINTSLSYVWSKRSTSTDINYSANRVVAQLTMDFN